MPNHTFLTNPNHPIEGFMPAPPASSSTSPPPLQIFWDRSSAPSLCFPYTRCMCLQPTDARLAANKASALARHTLFSPAAACCTTAIPTAMRHHDDLWRLCSISCSALILVTDRSQALSALHVRSGHLPFKRRYSQASVKTLYG
jgi:hypothetical protein